jgi:hypothetical protein
MAVYEELAGMLDTALIELSNHPNNELILPIRKQIWTLLGPRLIENSKAIHGIGLYRRTRLTMLCTQHVLSIWDKDWLANKGPQQMLSTAEEYLRKQLDYDSAWERMNRFWGELDNSEIGDNVSISVGFAAANVVAAALNDEQFDPNDEEDAQFLDEDYDPYDWDASFYASIAYAGGAPGDENSDLQRRKEFWEWYLKEAVPTAWEAQEYS